MRFIGGKSLLLDEINNVISENVQEKIEIIGDLFCGSAVVSQCFKSKGYKVISNDIMYMSYVLARGTLELNEQPKFYGLKNIDVFGYLNSIEEPLYAEKAFATKNYSPNNDCNRMYFQQQNAKKIDGIRQQIEEWKNGGKITESEYFYLLACLISAIPYVSNIAGVYAAYLKHWDKRTYNTLVISPLDIIKSKQTCEFYNTDAVKLCKEIKFDLVYIDTPYNQRQYTSNYHVLETIARYDDPIIHGVTGMREYEKSEFCSKSKVEKAFNKMFSNLDTKYAVVSYNNESLIPTEKMLEILSKYGNVKLYEYSYRRYKSKIPNNKKGLKEQLFFVDMR